MSKVECALGFLVVCCADVLRVVDEESMGGRWRLLLSRWKRYIATPVQPIFKENYQNKPRDSQAEKYLKQSEDNLRCRRRSSRTEKDFCDNLRHHASYVD